MAHRGRFSKPGDYHSFELAGFTFFLILGKDGVVRAFHNVCRHRAYTITRKKSGSSTVLGCRYHGWSYDTRGNLVKAPQFDNIEGFDKSKNGLFEIRAQTSRHGLIFINLDASKNVSDLDISDVDRFANQYCLSPRSIWIGGWDLGGDFNWKMAGMYTVGVSRSMVSSDDIR